MVSGILPTIKYSIDLRIERFVVNIYLSNSFKIRKIETHKNFLTLLCPIFSSPPYQTRIEVCSPWPEYIMIYKHTHTHDNNWYHMHQSISHTHEAWRSIKPNIHKYSKSTPKTKFSKTEWLNLSDSTFRKPAKTTARNCKHRRQQCRCSGCMVRLHRLQARTHLSRTPYSNLSKAKEKKQIIKGIQKLTIINQYKFGFEFNSVRNLHLQKTEVPKDAVCEWSSGRKAKRRASELRLEGEPGGGVTNGWWSENGSDSSGRDSDVHFFAYFFGFQNFWRSIWRDHCPAVYCTQGFG